MLPSMNQRHGRLLPMLGCKPRIKDESRTKVKKKVESPYGNPTFYPAAVARFYYSARRVKRLKSVTVKPFSTEFR